MTEPNYMTPAGHAKLLAELDQLVRAERPKVVREVQEAAAQGDRSENAEYIYGKRRLREIDSRLRFLSERLKRAEVVDPKTQSGDKVIFGAVVQVEDDNGVQKVWQLVGEDESEPSDGKISWRSPIGRLLLGKRVGGEFSFRRPDGKTVEYSILSITFER
jgi:transcription elongation factor GreB